MLAAAHPGMQGEAVRIGAQARRGFLVPARHGSQARHLQSGTRPQRSRSLPRGFFGLCVGPSGRMSTHADRHTQVWAAPGSVPGADQPKRTTARPRMPAAMTLSQ